MKTRITLLFFAFVISFGAFSQSPHAFNYQTVVRNSLGEIAVNKIVSFKISILKGSATGNAIYAETHNKATNGFGLATLEIGDGTAISGNFDNIDWGADIYFLKTEFDYNGGTNFIFMGTSQLLSVPYALYAEKAGNAENDNDKDSTNEIQTISKTDSTVTLSKNGGSFIDSDNQNLSLNGNQLTISSGNTVTFTGAVDLDADPTNELQNLTLNNDSISISQGNTIVLPHDADLDSTNEIQTIYKVGDTISLSKNGGSITDNDKQNLSLIYNGTDRTINISNGSGITLNIADNDNDTTNELQTLILNNDSLSISNGNSIYLSFLEYLVPIGSIMPFAGNTAPAGWLLCNGDTINKTIYNKLYNVIGNSWGAGNGTTTFNLPDFRGQFLRGVDGNAGIDPDKLTRTAKYTGGNTGNNVGSFQNDALKDHTHQSTSSQGGSTFYPNHTENIGNVIQLSGETRPVNAYVNYIIKY